MQARAEPRHLAGRTAHRQPVAQPVGVDRCQRLARRPGSVPTGRPLPRPGRRVAGRRGPRFQWSAG